MALVATLEAELNLSRSSAPREIEREVARRMKPLLEQTTAMSSEVEQMAQQRAAMERSHQAQVVPFMVDQARTERIAHIVFISPI